MLLKATILCAILVCDTAGPKEPVPSRTLDQEVSTLKDLKEEATLDVLTPLVAKWEGKRNRSYKDIVGVWTICYGHTRTAGPNQFKTDQECTDLLKEELIEYRDGVHEYFTQETKEERLTPERDAAYSSLGYNVGIRGAGKSTATRRLNSGNIVGGCKAIGWWNKAGGRVVRGLVNRRTEEVSLCLKGT